MTYGDGHWAEFTFILQQYVLLQAPVSQWKQLLLFGMRLHWNPTSVMWMQVKLGPLVADNPHYHQDKWRKHESLFLLGHPLDQCATKWLSCDLIWLPGKQA